MRTWAFMCTVRQRYEEAPVKLPIRPRASASLPPPSTYTVLMLNALFQQGHDG